MKTVSAYGSWKSPVSSQLVTRAGVGLLDVRLDCNTERTDTVYWTELRSQEQGRFVVCSYTIPTNTYQQWTPADFNAHNTVHEYGGASFCVYDGAVYFTNFEDQALYVQRSPDSVPEALTDVSKKWRFADGFVCPKRRVLYCIRENHEVISTGAKEAQNDVVAIDLDTKTLHVMAEGCDFYSHARVSPDGKKICWFQWDHPNMPWDDTEVWVAELDDSGCGVKDGSRRKMAGGTDECAIEPGWTIDNQFLYVSDKTDWWNLYHLTPQGTHVNLCPQSSEIAGRQHMFGNTAYVGDFRDSSKIVTIQAGKLGLVDMTDPKKYKVFDTGFASHKCLALSKTGDAFCLASGPDTFPCIIRFNIHSKQTQIIKESLAVNVDKGYLSTKPEFIDWQTTDNMTCHGIFYPPVNKDFQGPEGTKPPLLVRAHGGPTSHFSADLNLDTQYFTSRGFAVMLVNYRGSTNYGRSYRKVLEHKWGLYDVDDCCTAVEHLVKEGRVDADKVCIDGGSAGGYITLCCITFKNIFKAAASYCGIADLEAMFDDGHKFESRYNDSLLLPMDHPDCQALLKERSPIHHKHLINCPIALFHGDQDPIVLPNQSQMMYKAAKEKGLPCMLLMLEGEQHVLLKAENIQACLDGEFYFFSKMLGFKPADELKEFPIDNLK